MTIKCLIPLFRGHSSGKKLHVFQLFALVKDSHNRLSSTENACSSHLITHSRYVRIKERYTETLHMKKMADL